MPVRALHKPRRRFRQWVVVMTALACSGISGAFSSPSRAENVDVVARRSSERLSFSDSEIAEGFFAVAFGAELQFGKRVERIRKFDEPVRVFVDNRTASGRSAEIAAAIADIRAHVQHLDIAITEGRSAANLIVRIVHERDFSRTLSARFGSEKRGKSHAPSSRFACRVLARTKPSASAMPKSSCRGMWTISHLPTVCTRSCCKRLALLTTAARFHGPCSTTRFRWVSSIGMINIFSTSCTIRALHLV